MKEEKVSLPIKLALPDDFLKEEVRCGYLVASKLKAIWAVQLDLLSEFQRVCERHGIKYTLAFGSLLGAVRHSGFIPWDDDMDVWMTRPEYEKLTALGKTEFNAPYFLQTAESDRDYFLPYARLRNSKTTGLIRGYESESYNNGIYIDIFVLDGSTSNVFLKRIQRLCCVALDILLQARACKAYSDGKLKSKIIRCLRLVRPILCLIPFSVWHRLYVAIVSAFNAGAKNWTLATRSQRGQMLSVSRDAFAQLKTIEFENVLRVPIFKDSDEILTRWYGNWREFPDPALRGAWHEGVISYDPWTPYLEFLRNRK